MPSPESPANRMTARSMTSRFCFTGGTSMSVDILVLNLRSPMGSSGSPGGVRLDRRMRRRGERLASGADRREPTQRGYHIDPREAGRESAPRQCADPERREESREGLGE